MATLEAGRKAVGLAAGPGSPKDGTVALSLPLLLPLPSAASLCLSGSESEASCVTVDASCVTVEASFVTVAEAKSGESSGGIAVAEGKGGDDSALQTGESPKAEAYSEPGTTTPRTDDASKAGGGGEVRCLEGSCVTVEASCLTVGDPRNLEGSRSGESLASRASEGLESVGEEGAVVLLTAASGSGSEFEKSEFEDAPTLLGGVPSSGASECDEPESEDASTPLEAVCALAAQTAVAAQTIVRAACEEGALGRGDEELLLLSEVDPGGGTEALAPAGTLGSGHLEPVDVAGVKAEPELLVADEAPLRDGATSRDEAPLRSEAVAVAVAAASEGGSLLGTAMSEGYDDSTLGCRLSAAEKWADMLECGAEDILQFTYEDIAGPINQVSLPEPAIVSEAFPEGNTAGVSNLEKQEQEELDFSGEGAMEALEGIGGMGAMGRLEGAAVVGGIRGVGGLGLVEGTGGMGEIGEIGIGGLGGMEIVGMGECMDSRHESELRDSVSGSLRSFKGGVMDWENLALPEIYDFCEAAPCTPALPPRQRCGPGGPFKRRRSACGSGGDVGDGGECEFEGDYEAFCREMEAEGLALAPVPVRGRSKRVRKSKAEWAPGFLSLLQEKVPSRRRGGTAPGHSAGTGTGSGASAGAGVGAGAGYGAGPGTGVGSAIGGSGSPFLGPGRSPGSIAAGAGPMPFGGAEAQAGGVLAPAAGPGCAGVQSQGSGEREGEGPVSQANGTCGRTAGSLYGAGGSEHDVEGETQAVGVAWEGHEAGNGEEQKQGPFVSASGGAQKAHASGGSSSSNSNKRGNPYTETGALRRCSHCSTTKTPQWRAGPNGPKTLCNACGVRFKSGRLCAEYRPASSPEFEVQKHSNSHRRIVEMRKMRDGGGYAPSAPSAGPEEGRGGGPHGPSPLSRPHPGASGGANKKAKKSASSQSGSPSAASQAPKPKKAAAAAAAAGSASALGGSQGQKTQPTTQSQAQARGGSQAIAVGCAQGQGQGQEVRVRSQRLQQKKQMRRQQELEQQQEEEQHGQHVQQQQQQQQQQQHGQQSRPEGQSPEQDQAQAQAPPQATAQEQTPVEAIGEPTQAQADVPSHSKPRVQSPSPSQSQEPAQAHLPPPLQSQARTHLQSASQSQQLPQPPSQPQSGPSASSQTEPKATPASSVSASASASEEPGSSPVTAAPKSPVTVAPKSPVTVSRALSLSPVTVLGALDLSPVTKVEPCAGVPDAGATPGRIQSQSQASPPRHSQSQVTAQAQLQSPASLISVRVLVGEGPAGGAPRAPSTCCIELGKQFLGESLGLGEVLSRGGEKKVGLGGAGGREKEGGVGKGKGKENEAGDATGAGPAAGKAAVLVSVGGGGVGGGAGGLPVTLVSKAVGGPLSDDCGGKDKGAPEPQPQPPQGQQWQSPRKVNQMRASACPSNMPPLSYILPHKARLKAQDPRHPGPPSAPSLSPGIASPMPHTPTPTGSPMAASAKGEAAGGGKVTPVPVAHGQVPPLTVTPLTVTPPTVTPGTVTRAAPAGVKPLAVPPAAGAPAAAPAVPAGSPSRLCGPKTPVTVTPSPLSGPKTPVPMTVTVAQSAVAQAPAAVTPSPLSGPKTPVPVTVTPAPATVTPSSLSGPKTPAAAAAMGEPPVGVPWEDRGGQRRFNMRESVRVQA